MTNNSRISFIYCDTIILADVLMNRKPQRTVWCIYSLLIFHLQQKKVSKFISIVKEQLIWWMVILKSMLYL